MNYIITFNDNVLSRGKDVQNAEVHGVSLVLLFQEKGHMSNYITLLFAIFTIMAFSSIFDILNYGLKKVFNLKLSL